MDHIYALRLHDVFAEFEVQFVACDGLSAPTSLWSHVEAGTEEVVLADSGSHSASSPDWGSSERHLWGTTPSRPCSPWFCIRPSKRRFAPDKP